MPLNAPCDRPAFGDLMSQLKDDGYPQQQALAIALGRQRSLCSVFVFNYGWASGADLERILGRPTAGHSAGLAKALRKGLAFVGQDVLPELIVSRRGHSVPGYVLALEDPGPELDAIEQALGPAFVRMGVEVRLKGKRNTLDATTFSAKPHARRWSDSHPDTLARMEQMAHRIARRCDR